MKLISIAALMVAVAAGQATEPPLVARVPSVQARGRAKATAKPDQVRIDIGVTTQAKTAQEAAATNATRFSEVVAAVKKVAGADADIQTVSYTVQPNYRYPKEGGTPSIAGYTAQNIVRIRTLKVDKAGEIIDAGTGSGANQIRGIEFSVKDERTLRAQALRDAARDARAAVEAMAAGLGLRVLRILRVEESAGMEVQPVREMAMMRSMAADAAAPTPIEAGTIEAHATVVVTAEVAP
jgi:uncharacterized protein YggE